MPEGPECRRIADSLAKYVSGKTLRSINILSGRYVSKKPTGFSQINSHVPVGVVGVGVHGKFIYWILREEYSIWNTLGMTGSWRTDETPHARVSFDFTDGSRVYFTDQRNFGTIKFIKGKHLLIDKLKSLGPDMLAEDVTDQKFIDCMRTKNKHNICKVLMDQSIVCGVGNYIKSDSLWYARVNPHKIVSELTDQELSKLNISIKQVIRESFKTGGSTIGVYSEDEDDSDSYYSKFLVYNRKVDPDGNPILKETTPDGRTTFWSPRTQTK
tara:strand:+ start:422 stop:1231 length:810 start_codon:yes stop_codon:yes gene_type:complete